MTFREPICHSQIGPNSLIKNGAVKNVLPTNQNDLWLSGDEDNNSSGKCTFKLQAA